MPERHPEDTQTLYSELLTLLLARESGRTWSHLAGTFTTKSVGGRDYLYFQFSDPGGSKRQFAVGPRTRSAHDIVRRYRQERERVLEEDAAIGRLARMLRTAGIAVLPHPVARVLRALADSGVFHVGGVLVGSYAFALIGNALGVRWPGPAWRTHDKDVAGGLELVAPGLQADVPRALDSLAMGFVPVPQLDPRHPSTSFKVRGKTLRVDLLTPGREEDQAPVFLPRFQAAAAPIRYLSLLLAEAQPAAAVDGGATLVRVPDPARFALHKLLISQLRSMAQHTKRTKDLHQAALLLEVLAEERPDDLARAADSFRACGPGVARKVLRALGSTARQHPAAAAGVEALRRTLK